MRNGVGFLKKGVAGRVEVGYCCGRGNCMQGFWTTGNLLWQDPSSRCYATTVDGDLLGEVVELVSFSSTSEKEVEHFDKVP